jgi:hypothetical protein
MEKRHLLQEMLLEKLDICIIKTQTIAIIHRKVRKKGTLTH